MKPFNIQSLIWKEVEKLDEARRIAFIEFLADLLGYDEDYYTGWNVQPPSFAIEILEASEEQLQKAWEAVK